MDRQRTTPLLLVLGVLALAVAGIGLAHAWATRAQSPADKPAGAVSSGFTFQGRLDGGGAPVDDTCQMAFRLYDAAAGGLQVGAPITTSVAITGGLFTVQLNQGGEFGADAFNGEQRWLDIRVQCTGDLSYTPLGRQELTASPYALYALRAPWEGVQGLPAGFADNVDDDTQYSAGSGLVLTGTQFSARGSPYAQVLVVAQGGGDFDTVQAAVDHVTPTADAPVLIWVAPGVYTGTVTLKPHIHLQGAGRDATVLASDAGNGALPPAQATLVLAAYSTVQDLTVRNTGAGPLANVALLATGGVSQTTVADVNAWVYGAGQTNHAILLHGAGTGANFDGVVALAQNGTGENTGLEVADGAAAGVQDSTFLGQGGDEATGVYSHQAGTALFLTNVTAVGENGTTNRGLRNEAAVCGLTGGTFLGRGGGTTSYGIANSGAGAYVDAEGTGAAGQEASSYNYGFYNTDSATAVLRRADINALGGQQTRGIYNSAALTAHDVVASAANASATNAALHNHLASGSAVLYGGSFIGRGGTDAKGMGNSDGATLVADNSVSLGEGSTGFNTGLHQNNAFSTLRGGSYSGHGGASARGILVFGTALTAENLTLEASGGSADNFALYTWSTTVQIGQAVLRGGTNAISASGGSTTVANTRLEGGPVSGAVTCVGVSRGTTFFANGCP